MSQNKESRIVADLTYNILDYVKPRKFLIYDHNEFYPSIKTPEAKVLYECKNEEEAHSYKNKTNDSCITCYYYVVEGDKLTDEYFEWSWCPGDTIVLFDGGKK